MKAWQIGLYSVLLFASQLSATLLVVLAIGVEQIGRQPFSMYGYLSSGLISVAVFTYIAWKHQGAAISSSFVVGSLTVVYAWMTTYMILPNGVMLPPPKLLLDFSAMVMALFIGNFIGSRLSFRQHRDS